MQSQPIFYDGDGRSVLGHARTVKQAERIIRAALTIHPSMTLRVWERPDYLQEINGLAPGWVYAISYRYR